MDEIKAAIKGAIKRKDTIWVEMLLPKTWLEYRLRETAPDLLLVDPANGETWFPVCTADERYSRKVYLPALWEAVLNYTADQDQIEGIVINPYSKEPFRLPCSVIQEILDEIGIK